jgi:hypothetical protein
MQATNLEPEVAGMIRRVPIGRVIVPGIVALLGLLSGHGTAVAGPQGPWVPAVEQVDAALARKEYSAALRAANQAYMLALASERWDGLIAAGDLYRRIGQATGLHVSFELKAREAYQRALFRARHQASVEGVLRATEAYAALGDEKMVTLGLRVAERLAAGNREALADVRSFRARMESGASMESGMTAGDLPR